MVSACGRSAKPHVTLSTKTQVMRSGTSRVRLFTTGYLGNLHRPVLSVCIQPVQSFVSDWSYRQASQQIMNFHIIVHKFDFVAFSANYGD